MSKTVAGRKPLSSKKTLSALQAPSFFQDRFSLPQPLVEELKAQNLDYRFIDYKKYVDNGGVHQNGWTAYRPKSKEGLDPIIFGANPDGLIRRGTAILAARPMVYTEQHREHLAAKNDVYRRFKQSKAEEMRQRAREDAADTVIDDEFDDDNNE